MWVRFHSDESIEYSGFQIFYKFLINRDTRRLAVDECWNIMQGQIEGDIDSSAVGNKQRQFAMNHSLPHECAWDIRVLRGYRVNLHLTDIEMETDSCERNMIQIYDGITSNVGLRKQQCSGGAGVVIQSNTNRLFIRFYLHPAASNSSFRASFAMFRTAPAN
ncbi:PREDICTED: neuropilin and tolloid-like protein 2, partial [Priapulus caudatus]|uniref:Neuropilin and tolloid-like protein 2 n=1 Tax=Priapulus caudatus TaxID=37621 RepID=A0ABM1F4W8_PRICU